MTNGPSGNYEDIFENQGVPVQFRGPEDYFFHTVTEAESEDHAGETYAIPTQLYVRGDLHGLYDVYENGAIVNVRTDIDPDAEVAIEGRAVIDARSVEGDTSIGWGAVVGSGVQLYKADVGSEVEISPKAYIGDAKIGNRSKIGEEAIIEGNRGRSQIGPEAEIEDYARLMGNNIVGRYSRIGWGAILEEGAGVGDQVEIDESAKLRMLSYVRDGSRVMPKVEVKARKTIRPKTIVVPEHYDHAKRGW